MLTGFTRTTRWPRRRFSESYAVQIPVKISRICEFRVLMGIMTGLPGCCSSSTLGSRANDYVKTHRYARVWRMITSKLRSGFNCIIRPAPSGAGRTTPSQPGHYPLNSCWIYIRHPIPLSNGKTWTLCIPHMVIQPSVIFGCDLTSKTLACKSLHIMYCTLHQTIRLVFWTDLCDQFQTNSKIFISINLKSLMRNLTARRLQ